MAKNTIERPKPATVVAAFAVLFGVLTLYSGGAVLFFDGPSRAAAGAYMPLVVWFNFIAGFAYIIAGLGIFLWRRWAAALSLAIAGTTIIVFAIFGWNISNGALYEMRTVGAMALRSIVWLAIGLYTCRSLFAGSSPKVENGAVV